MQARTEIPSGPQAPAEARAFVRSAADRLPGPLLDDACLMVSELVTNSHQHAGLREGSPIRVTIDLSEERLRLEVIDHSIFDPTPETTEELREGKWGLRVVNRIAERWGRHSEGGVWVELPNPQGEGRA